MIKIIIKTVDIPSLCEYKFWHNLQLRKKQGRHNYLANHNTALFVTFQYIFVKYFVKHINCISY